MEQRSAASAFPGEAAYQRTCFQPLLRHYLRNSKKWLSMRVSFKEGVSQSQKACSQLKMLLWMHQISLSPCYRAFVNRQGVWHKGEPVSEGLSELDSVARRSASFMRASSA